jgi:hypothetical protein
MPDGCVHAVAVLMSRHEVWCSVGDGLGLRWKEGDCARKEGSCLGEAVNRKILDGEILDELRLRRRMKLFGFEKKIVDLGLPLCNVQHEHVLLKGFIALETIKGEKVITSIIRLVRNVQFKETQTPLMHHAAMDLEVSRSRTISNPVSLIKKPV